MASRRTEAGTEAAGGGGEAGQHKVMRHEGRRWWQSRPSILVAGAVVVGGATLLFGLVRQGISPVLPPIPGGAMTTVCSGQVEARCAEEGASMSGLTIPWLAHASGEPGWVSATDGLYDSALTVDGTLVELSSGSAFSYSGDRSPVPGLSGLTSITTEDGEVLLLWTEEETPYVLRLVDSDDLQLAADLFAQLEYVTPADRVG